MQNKNTPNVLLKKVLKNTSGFIDKIPTILDFVQGLETGIAYEALNPAGDWTPYTPTPERQYNKKVDYLACTSFSHLNVREMRFNYKLTHNLFPQHVVEFLTKNGYIAADGKVNFSDRFTAKLANTNVVPPGPGAALPTVAEAVRLNGLVPESLWPTTENMTWDEYYAPIPAEVLALGQKSREVFDFLYEWVDINLALIDEPLNADTLKALKQSPLQIAIPIPSRHATSLYFAEVKTNGEENIKIFDTYEPFYFTGAKDYPIYYSMKLVEVVKAPKPVLEKPSYTFTRTLKIGMAGPDVMALQKVLQYEGDFKYIPTEYFGYRTQNALKAFQKRNKLTVDGIAGTKQTLALINKIYGVKKKALE